MKRFYGGIQDGIHVTTYGPFDLDDRANAAKATRLITRQGHEPHMALADSLTAACRYFEHAASLQEEETA